jgi:hypothetical protein
MPSWAIPRRWAAPRSRRVANILLSVVEVVEEEVEVEIWREQEEK